MGHITCNNIGLTHSTGHKYHVQKRQLYLMYQFDLEKLKTSSITGKKKLIEYACFEILPLLTKIVNEIDVPTFNMESGSSIKILETGIFAKCIATVILTCPVYLQRLRRWTGSVKIAGQRVIHSTFKPHWYHVLVSGTSSIMVSY